MCLCYFKCILHQNSFKYLLQYPWNSYWHWLKHFVYKNPNTKKLWKSIIVSNLTTSTLTPTLILHILNYKCAHYNCQVYLWETMFYSLFSTAFVYFKILFLKLCFANNYKLLPYHKTLNLFAILWNNNINEMKLKEVKKKQQHNKQQLQRKECFMLFDRKEFFKDLALVFQQ